MSNHPYPDENIGIRQTSVPLSINHIKLDIDGRPRFAKLSIDNVEKVEIAAIDPDFIEAEASVPDGMR